MEVGWEASQQGAGTKRAQFDESAGADCGCNRFGCYQSNIKAAFARRGKEGWSTLLTATQQPSERRSSPPALQAFQGCIERGCRQGLLPKLHLKGCPSFASVLISDSANRRGGSLSSTAPGPRPTKRPHVLLGFMTFNSRINEAAEEPLQVQGREVMPGNNRWQTAKVRRMESY